MSTTVVRPVRPAGAEPTGVRLGQAAVVVVACGLLLARAWAPVPDGASRPAAGIVLFGAVLLACLLVPVRRPAGPFVRRATALGVGLVAMVVAALAGGTPVPLVAAAWTLPMSILAAVAEEALFRRVAYGGLERFGPAAAIVGAALLFAAVHVPLYGVAALPVDLGAGLVFGWQRWASGSWAVPATTHAAANVVAVLR